MRNLAASALEVLGKDFSFPHKLDGLPGSLSEFADLKIGFFVTNDGVKLSYWEAGEGEPLVFIPGWSASGARYINVMYLLARHYRVIVLDPRSHGLSQRVDYGTRIARYSMDLKELVDHLGLEMAAYCGWSMGAAILWGYIDLFGTKGIRKVAFVDEPISIYAHSDWSEQQRREAGAMTTSAEQLAASLTAHRQRQPPRPAFGAGVAVLRELRELRYCFHHERSWNGGTRALRSPRQRLARRGPAQDRRAGGDLHWRAKL
jgi:pimeloyl-ACP methyl ester carboxylesterase